MTAPAATYAPSSTRSPVYAAPARPAAPRAAFGGAPAAAHAARYRDAELMAATPGQLVVLLFDKLTLTLRRARVAMEARHIEERATLLLAADDMLTELRASLDHEQGGAISRDLDALYAFMVRELHAANRQQDAERVDVVLRIATELREAFAGALQQVQPSATVTPLAARVA